MENLKQKLLELGVFDNLNYLDKYVELIKTKALPKAIKFKTQKHHIIPKCYFKIIKQAVDNSDSNIVHLKFIDHVRAHCLLILASKKDSLFQYYNYCAINHLTGKLHIEPTEQDIKDLESLYQSEEYQKSYELGRIAASKNNPMKVNPAVREKQTKLMKSPEMRAKISATMHKLRTTIGFLAEHRAKISKALMKNHNFGTGDTRSLSVYCELESGQKYTFHSIKEAGKWWYENYKPFGEIYSEATYQRKIKASIAGNEIHYGNKTHTTYKVITDIKWFFTKNDKI